MSDRMSDGAAGADAHSCVTDDDSEGSESNDQENYPVFCSLQTHVSLSVFPGMVFNFQKAYFFFPESRPSRVNKYINSSLGTVPSKQVLSQYLLIF